MEEYRETKMKVWQRCVYLLLFLLYLLFGGMVFHFLESGNETANKNVGAALISNMLASHSCLTTASLTTYTKAVIDLYDQGVLASPNASTDSIWDFASSIYFSGTVVTTIGYGHMSPSTDGGRIFFTFYAMFGIAFCLLGLSEFGDVLYNAIKHITDKVSCCKQKPKLHKWLSFFTVHIMFAIFLVFVQAAVLTAVEGWGYHTSLYFIVVTFTTVGFGDYVPGFSLSGPGQGFYRIYTFLWTFVGLIWFSSLISSVQEAVTKIPSKTEDKTEEDKTEGRDEEDVAAVEGKDSLKLEELEKAEGDALPEVTA